MMLGGVNRVRLRELVRKELHQMLRDPRSKRLIFVAPVVQLMLFGYAVNTDVRNAPTIVMDHDRTSDSRELLDAFVASGYFRIVHWAARPAEIVAALDRSEALVGLEIPRGFAADLAAGRQARVQVLIDGTTANTANGTSRMIHPRITSVALSTVASPAWTASNDRSPRAACSVRTRRSPNPSKSARITTVRTALSSNADTTSAGR